MPVLLTPMIEPWNMLRLSWIKIYYPRFFNFPLDLGNQGFSGIFL